jgi:hypothetical protein
MKDHAHRQSRLDGLIRVPLAVRLAFAITDRAAPRLLRTIESSATYISARKVGSAVHTVLYEEPELLRWLTARHS